MNICFCTLAFRHTYCRYAKNLIKSIRILYPNVTIFVATDRPEFFTEQNIIKVVYKEREFIGKNCIFNKLIKEKIIEHAYNETNNTVIYLDSTCELVKLLPSFNTDVLYSAVDHVLYVNDKLKYLNKQLYTNVTACKNISPWFLVVSSKEFLKKWKNIIREVEYIDVNYSKDYSVNTQHHIYNTEFVEISMACTLSKTNMSNFFMCNHVYRYCTEEDRNFLDVKVKHYTAKSITT